VSNEQFLLWLHVMSNMCLLPVNQMLNLVSCDILRVMWHFGVIQECWYCLTLQCQIHVTRHMLISKITLTLHKRLSDLWKHVWHILIWIASFFVNKLVCFACLMPVICKKVFDNSFTIVTHVDQQIKYHLPFWESCDILRAMWHFGVIQECWSGLTLQSQINVTKHMLTYIIGYLTYFFHNTIYHDNTNTLG
jgi:hypothetical protein